MNVELEKELAKISNIKKSIEEMGASLWQSISRKAASWIRISNARTEILGKYQKSGRSH